MFVVSGGADEHVLVVGFLDGAQKLLAALYLLQALLRYAQREIDDLTVPYIHRPAQGADNNLDFARSLRTEHVGRIQTDARGQGQENVGHCRTVRRALMAVVRQRFGLGSSENAPLDGVQNLAPLAEFLFEQCAFDAAVENAYGDALAGGARMVQQTLWRYQREQIGENIVGWRLAHERISPIISSSSWRRLSTSRMQ